MISAAALGDDSTGAGVDRLEGGGIESTSRGGGVEIPKAIGPFELRRKIGHGTYGDVFEGFDPEREIRAALWPLHYLHPDESEAIHFESVPGIMRPVRKVFSTRSRTFSCWS